MLSLESVQAAGRQRVLAELRALFGSRSLRLSLLLMLLGGVLWFRREQQAPAKESTSAAAVKAQADGKGAQVSPSSPATFRLGAGYAGGFLIGFAFRRFLKLMSAFAALALAGLAALKATGVIELDWAGLEQHVRDSLAWTHGQAEAAKTFLTGYLPSATAGGVGLWKGFRRKPVAAPPA